MPLAMVFVDGVGIGPRDPARNPLARRETLLSQFSDGDGTALPFGGRVDPVDACLGVPGRPQSATGQTALLTGENASALLGKHLLGYPNARLRAELERASVFRHLRDEGRTFAFANGYPSAYLEAVGLAHTGAATGLEIPERYRRKLRAAATPYAFATAGGILHTLADVTVGAGLTHDLTGRLARERGAEVPARTPAEAAAVFVRIAATADFALVDYFLTDDAGHAQDFEAADRSLADLDGFLRALLEGLPLERHSVVVISDHGNLEDLSTRNHTLNPVPLLRFGPAAAQPAPRRLDEVLPLLLAGARP